MITFNFYYSFYLLKDPSQPPHTPNLCLFIYFFKLTKFNLFWSYIAQFETIYGSVLNPPGAIPKEICVCLTHCSAVSSPASSTLECLSCLILYRSYACCPHHCQLTFASAHLSVGSHCFRLIESFQQPLSQPLSVGGKGCDVEVPLGSEHSAVFSYLYHAWLAVRSFLKEASEMY